MKCLFVHLFQTVDDLIVALMSMGFELDDCHDAIQQGKVTVETAVEWYTQPWIYYFLKQTSFVLYFKM